MGSTIIQLTATDPDFGLNSQVLYRLADSSVSSFGDLFDINEKTGELFTKRPVKYEDGTSYPLSVMAMDRGPNSLPTYVRVLVSVTDVNNHAPEISVNALTESGRAEVAENAGVGMFVAHISVKDADSGINGEVKCTLHNDYFSLEPLFAQEFKVVSTVDFDRELKNEYHINVVCQDMGNPPMTSSIHIPVTVVDVNDHVPEFGKQVYPAVIPENNPIGTFIAQLNATDGDTGRNAAINFKTLYPQDESIITVDLISGLVTANTVFDYETQVYYEIPVLASDLAAANAKTATALIKISIMDSNDEPPKFILDEYKFSVEENQPANTTVGVVSATDLDSEPFNVVSYKLDPNPDASEFFHLDPNSGRISTKKVLDRESRPEFRLKVVTFNPQYSDMTNEVNVTIFVTDVNDNRPVIVFPNDVNNTIDLSNKLPKGYLITKIQATDPDDGSNSILSYYFSKQTEKQDLFTLDSKTGEIRVKDELSTLDYSRVKMSVTVLDSGHPPLEAHSNLYVIVNKSIPFVVSHPEAGPNGPLGESVSGSSRSSAQKWLIVGLIIGVFLLIVVVVIVIAACRRTRHKKYTKKNMYNCRLEEALKKQQALQNHSACNGTTHQSDPKQLAQKDTVQNGKVHTCHQAFSSIRF